MIVSVGAGSGATKLSSSVLTLCLDINKRSIFTGLSQVKSDLARNTTIFAFYYYSKHIEELIQTLKELDRTKKIRFLLQHPTPSIDERNRSALNILFESIKTCLKKSSS